jgi:hypothetical protein
MEKETDTYSEAETARRRDATIKNMLGTPPQPRKPKRKPSRAKSASAKRAGKR